MIMKKLFIAGLLALPLGIMAEEVADTTVVYNGKQFVISEDSVETHIKVLDSDGTEWKKSKESTFANNQEVERFYVSSPLFPGGSQLYSSMYPTIWWGTSSLNTHLSTKSNNGSMATDGLHTKGSYEIGFTTAEAIIPINRSGTILFSNAVQVVFSRYKFQNSALLSNVGRHIAFEDRTAAPASASYMSVASMRLPFMLAWAPTVNWPSDWLNTQIGLAIVPEYRFGKAAYRFDPEAFGDPINRSLKIYHWGLNVDFNMAMGPVKFGVSVGLLPLFKTVDGKKAFYASLNLGINIGELFKKRSQNGSF